MTSNSRPSSILDTGTRLEAPEARISRAGGQTGFHLVLGFLPNLRTSTPDAV